MAGTALQIDARETGTDSSTVTQVVVPNADARDTEMTEVEMVQSASSATTGITAAPALATTMTEQKVQTGPAPVNIVGDDIVPGLLPNGSIIIRIPPEGHSMKISRETNLKALSDDETTIVTNGTKPTEEGVLTSENESEMDLGECSRYSQCGKAQRKEEPEGDCSLIQSLRMKDSDVIDIVASRKVETDVALSRSRSSRQRRPWQSKSSDRHDAGQRSDLLTRAADSRKKDGLPRLARYPQNTYSLLRDFDTGKAMHKRREKTSDEKSSEDPSEIGNCGKVHQLEPHSRFDPELRGIRVAENTSPAVRPMQEPVKDLPDGPADDTGASMHLPDYEDQPEDDASPHFNIVDRGVAFLVDKTKRLHQRERKKALAEQPGATLNAGKHRSGINSMALESKSKETATSGAATSFASMSITRKRSSTAALERTASDDNDTLKDATAEASAPRHLGIESANADPPDRTGAASPAHFHAPFVAASWPTIAAPVHVEDAGSPSFGASRQSDAGATSFAAKPIDPALVAIIIAAEQPRDAASTAIPSTQSSSDDALATSTCETHLRIRVQSASAPGHMPPVSTTRSFPSSSAFPPALRAMPHRQAKGERVPVPPEKRKGRRPFASASQIETTGTTAPHIDDHEAGAESNARYTETTQVEVVQWASSACSTMGITAPLALATTMKKEKAKTELSVKIVDDDTAPGLVPNGFDAEDSGQAGEGTDPMKTEAAIRGDYDYVGFGEDLPPSQVSMGGSECPDNIRFAAEAGEKREHEKSTHVGLAPDVFEVGRPRTPQAERRGGTTFVAREDSVDRNRKTEISHQIIPTDGHSINREHGLKALSDDEMTIMTNGTKPTEKGLTSENKSEMDLGECSRCSQGRKAQMIEEPEGSPPLIQLLRTKDEDDIAASTKPEARTRSRSRTQRRPWQSSEQHDAGACGRRADQRTKDADSKIIDRERNGLLRKVQYPENAEPLRRDFDTGKATHQRRGTKTSDEKSSEDAMEIEDSGKVHQLEPHSNFDPELRLGHVPEDTSSTGRPMRPVKNLLDGPADDTGASMHVLDYMDQPEDDADSPSPQLKHFRVDSVAAFPADKPRKQLHQRERMKSLAAQLGATLNVGEHRSELKRLALESNSKEAAILGATTNFASTSTTRKRSTTAVLERAASSDDDTLTHATAAACAPSSLGNESAYAVPLDRTDELQTVSARAGAGAAFSAHCNARFGTACSPTNAGPLEVDDARYPSSGASCRSDAEATCSSFAAKSVESALAATAIAVEQTDAASATTPSTQCSSDGAPVTTTCAHEPNHEAFEATVNAAESDDVAPAATIIAVRGVNDDATPEVTTEAPGSNADAENMPSSKEKDDMLVSSDGTLEQNTSVPVSSNAAPVQIVRPPGLRNDAPASRTEAHSLADEAPTSGVMDGVQVTEKSVELSPKIAPKTPVNEVVEVSDCSDEEEDGKQSKQVRAASRKVDEDENQDDRSSRRQLLEIGMQDEEEEEASTSGALRPVLSDAQREMADEMLAVYQNIPNGMEKIQDDDHWTKIDLRVNDMRTLAPRGWLNDNVVDCYLKIALRDILGTEVVDKKVLCWNTQWWMRISGEGKGQNTGEPQYCYANVKRWPLRRKADIFALDLMIVPRGSGTHWSLGVVDFRRKRLIHICSLGLRNTLFMEVVRRYLTDEWKDKKNGEGAFSFDGWTELYSSDFEKELGTRVPLQDNDFDCGMFTILYAVQVAEQYRDRGTERGPSFRFTFSQQQIHDYRRKCLLELRGAAVAKSCPFSIIELVQK
ncbi:unnamed protein product [Amoebophrya sp. A25]|nr:unnamed protein product [Amoebophrya sp. A25]|eukprot:GSA25T00002151001.1